MHFLGAGACSIVFALSEEEAREWGHLLPSHLLWQLALRLSARKLLRCPTCCDALNDFIGFRLGIGLDDKLRERCAAAYPLFAARCQEALYAELVSNFAADPRHIQLHGGRSTSDGVGTEAMTDSWPHYSTLAMEIKPKGVWRRPAVVGVVVDGVEYYLHPIKLRQCRFSLMQLLKRKRHNHSTPVSMERRCTYCPNQLLLGDGSSIVDALQHLSEHPGNNLAILHATDAGQGLNENSIDIVSSVLRRSGILSILANLQLFGSSSSCEWPVLDIELLFRWSEALNMSSVRWIVCSTCEGQFAAESCACQSELPLSLCMETCSGIHLTHFIAPPMGFEECVERFYASVTAKDVSVLVALTISEKVELPPSLSSPPKFGMDGSAAEEKSANLCSSPRVRFIECGDTPNGVTINLEHPQAAICRVGVVDLDAKWHKPLSRYFELDREVLAAWEDYKVVSAPEFHC